MFDPYHKWLGIPKDQRPPTFYQLLGITPTETDAEVIEEAAIRQTTHVRAYQIGPHAAECTRLLNEIALARQTLLNAAKRKEYDQKLAPKPARPAVPAQAKPSVTVPVARPASKSAAGEPESDVGSSSVWLIPVVGVGIVALVLAGLGMFLFVARVPKPPEPREIAAVELKAGPETVDVVEPAVPQTPPPPLVEKPPAEVKPDVKPGAEAKVEPKVEVKPEVKPPPETKTETKPPAETKPAPQVKAEMPPPRLPVPDEAQVKPAEKAVLDSLKSEYAAAKKGTAEKVLLTEKLLQLAAETKDDAAARYALLRESLNQATAAGRPRLALQAVEEIGRRYDVDLLDTRQTALANLGKSPALAKDKDAAFELAQAALDAAGECVSADKLPLAGQFLATADVAAKKSASKEMQASVVRHDKELKQIAKEFEQLQAARERLADDPDDAKANLEVGSYLALRKGDWENGLPRLSKAKDGPLPLLARKDLAAGTDAKAQRELGDDWWAAAESEAPGWFKYALQNRAAHWYRQALPELTGFTQVQTLKKIQQVEDQPAPLQLADNLGQVRRLLKAHAGEIKHLALSSDGKHLYSGGLDSKINIWETGGLKPVFTHLVQFPVVSFDFAPLNAYLAVCTPESGKVYDMRKKNWIQTWDCVPALFFTGAETIYRVERDGVQRRHILPGGKSTKNENEKGILFRLVVPSPSRKSVLLIYDEGSRLYQTTDFVPRGSVGDFKATAGAIAPDERTIALAAPDYSIWLYDVNEGGQVKVLRTLPANHTGPIRTLNFAPGGQRLLSAGDDKTVRVWDVPTGREMKRYGLHTGPVYTAVISADGRFAFTAGGDLTIRQWALPRESR